MTGTAAPAGEMGALSPCRPVPGQQAITGGPSGQAVRTGSQEGRDPARRPVRKGFTTASQGRNIAFSSSMGRALCGTCRGLAAKGRLGSRRKGRPTLCPRPLRVPMKATNEGAALHWPLDVVRIRIQPQTRTETASAVGAGRKGRGSSATSP